MNAQHQLQKIQELESQVQKLKLQNKQQSEQIKELQFYKTLVETSSEGITSDSVQQLQIIQSIINKSPMVLFLSRVDPETWPIKLVTSNVHRLLGYTAEDFMSGRYSWLHITHPDDAPRLEAEILKYIKSEVREWSQEYRLITKSGEIRWINDWNMTLHDSEGAMAYVQTIVVDVTEKKQIELALRKSEEKFRTLSNDILDGIAILIDGKNRWVNNAFINIFGYTKEEIIEQSIDFLFIPEEVPRVLDQMHQQPEGEDIPTHYETVGKRNDGWLIHLEVSTKTIEFEGNSAIQMVIRDITKRKKAEAALRESEEKYRHLIQHSGDAIYLLYNRRFEVINQKFREMFGITSEDANKPEFDFMDLVAPKSRQLVSDRMKRLQKGEKLEPKYEFTAIDVNGNEIEIETSVTYIKYKNGIATQGILRDITKRKRLESQLLQAQKMEAVGQLAGGVAHDFNNLLTVILGYCDMLLSQSLAPEVRSDVIEILEAGERAKRLTNQLMTFGRKQVIQPKVIDINILITEQYKMLHRLLGEDIEIDVRLSPAVGKVKIDPAQLEQIIVNLAVNGRDAMPFGGKLVIETSNVEFTEDDLKNNPESQPGKYVMLGITDSGIGMDNETRAHIFEPFFTTKGRNKGTGLGLATVYGIVKQNKGHIVVQSELRKGTSFKIFLKMENPTIRSDDIQVESLDLCGTETILLVEDDPGVCKVTRNALAKYNYNVLTAENGKAALAIYQQQQGGIDLILTDVVMPVMSGKELVDILLKKDPHLKIIFFSGYTDDAIAHHGVLDSDIAFIQKPYSHKELAQKIRDVLDG